MRSYFHNPLVSQFPFWQRINFSKCQPTHVFFVLFMDTTNSDLLILCLSSHFSQISLKLYFLVGLFAKIVYNTIRLKLPILTTHFTPSY